MSEEKKKTSGPDPKILFLVLAAVVVVIMMVVQHGRSGGSGSDTCTVVPQSPWGQSQSQAWTEVQTVPEGKAIAGFDFSYPQGPEGFEKGQLRAYTKQAFEIVYSNDQGEEGMRVDKALVCGKDVYEGLYKDQNEYDNQNTVEVNGVKYKEKGNDGKISTIQWKKGDYSYGIAFWSHPVSKEEAEKLAAQVK